MGIVFRDSAATVRRLRQLQEQAARKTADAIQRAAAVALAVAQSSTTPGLRPTLAVKPLNQYAVRVTSSSKAAVFHENGAAPHIIAPRNGRVLAFEVAGSRVFARAVRHPGAPALRFMARGREAGRIYLRSVLHDILKG